jgi:hypothetical protein
METMTEIVPVEARETIPLRSIEELCAIAISEWNAMDELLERTQKKVQARRIKIGHLLLELQQRIDAGGNGDLCTFWGWYEDTFTRSRRDAERLMAIARDDNPEAAYQRQLEKQKEYNERYHRRRLGAPTRESEAEPTALSPPDIKATPPQSSKMETEPEPSPRPSRFPEADGDDEIIEEIVALYQQLSWGGRDKAATRILTLYNEWKRGGR